MKLAHWSLHFYRLPYVREVRWVYAAESSGDYALLTIVADNGTAGVAEGVIKPTRTGASPRSLMAVLETVILPQLQGLNLLDEKAVLDALARIPENRLAKAMVDNACWALRAAAAGKPLWQLLGGKPEIDLAYILTRQTPERMAAEAAEGGILDLSPDFVFESRGRVTPDGYEIEVRIPFQSIRFQSAERQSWGVNVVRQVQHAGQTQTWTPVDRGASGLLASRLGCGSLILHRGVRKLTAEAMHRKANAGAVTSHNM